MKHLDRMMLGFLGVVTLAALAVLAIPFLLAALQVTLPMALAAPDGQVTVPYGDWLSAALTTLNALPIGEIVFGWLIAVLIKLGLPAQLVAMFRTMVTEQMLQKAIDFALNAVAGAAKGRKLEVRLANPVIEQAADYVVENGPPWLVNWLGGEEGIRKRIMARLDLVPEARIAESGEIVNGVLSPGI